MLEVRDLVKHYPTPGGETVRALDGVSLNVAAGEFVALYGPSGSGKTTLLTIVAAALVPDAGDVRVDSRSVIGLPEREVSLYRQRELGLMLPTHNVIAGLTAIDNASLKLLAGSVSKRAEARRRVEPLLRRLGLAARAQHRATDLSLGERQRLMLAAALSTDPPLLVADEPTGSLDTARSRDVLAFLRERSHERGTAVLVATHDPQATAFADTVYTLRDGLVGAFDRERDADLTTTLHRS
ncbi:ABC transporter ATP-binding protein [Conexibacter sp. JD483]|uniref:ABC transporter ATP-binding protein n=1 Tax=unclassified Conexibacter TaxID=2627773 RepID=UPI00271E2DE6|nr:MULTISPECIES: ABC transporter ATP-binding protein [unclassified Conexibacter]MDO8185800.1 ABC transporter ATP-binding protein [Conexibacter sp. CPCC 205706]MDO8198544.1 ABC transporter ATP-binding protein [Conexibacter sp. CPCC 205762]MDR9367630.1 ABC transporter ATP-binding protein [Conexibacter sp. JD483]